MAKQKTSKKAKQNEKSAKAYAAAGRYEINKARKLLRHLREFPSDEGARNTLNSLSKIAVDKARSFFSAPLEKTHAQV